MMQSNDVERDIGTQKNKQKNETEFTALKKLPWINYLIN